MKKAMVFAVAMVFTVSVASVSFAAKSVKCTVDAVDGDKVTMTCEKADAFKAGDDLKIKPPKGGGAIEGC